MEEQTPEAFVQEAGYSGTGVRPNKRPWTRWTLAVLLLTLATAVLGIAATLVWVDQDNAQVYMIPVVPSVSLPSLMKFW